MDELKVRHDDDILKLTHKRCQCHKSLVNVVNTSLSTHESLCVDERTMQIHHYSKFASFLDGNIDCF